MTERLRLAIVEVYQRFGTPADQVVCDAVLAGEFADAVNELVGPEEMYSVMTVNCCLLRLRKRGVLPRLVR